MGDSGSGVNSHKEVRVMDAPRFDAWTRRRFGLATGGLIAALVGLGPLGPTTAKHRHHKKKRCRTLGAVCGGKRPCCGQLLCARTIMNAGTETLCCKREGKACSGTVECCDGFACDEFDIVCVPLKSDRAL
jgi:hypothetical protein